MSGILSNILAKNIKGKNLPIFRRFAVTKEELPNKINQLKQEGIIPIIDYGVETTDNTLKTYSELLKVQKKYTNNFHAIKLSGIKPILDYNDNTLPNMIQDSINNGNQILIDAEDSYLDKFISDKTNHMIEKFNVEHPYVYKTYQMYRKDSFMRLVDDIDNANKNDYNLGIKLVRGAYHRQELHKNVVFTEKEETDQNYNNGISYIFNNLDLGKSSLIIASHNEESIERTKNLIKYNDDNANVYFATLLGMKDNTTKQLLRENYKVMKYVPYGDIMDMLPYLLRRLNENKYMIKHIW